MNLDLLRDVRNVIVANPSGFNMGTWVMDHKCGTTCCIAGHAYFLSVGREPNMDEICVSSRAMKFLRISPSQALHLFHAGRWPTSFKYIAPSRLEAKYIAPSRLEAAIELLDRLIDGRIVLNEQGKWLGDLKYPSASETQKKQTEELSAVHEEALV